MNHVSTRGYPMLDSGEPTSVHPISVGIASSTAVLQLVVETIRALARFDFPVDPEQGDTDLSEWVTRLERDLRWDPACCRVEGFLAGLLNIAARQLGAPLNWSELRGFGQHLTVKDIEAARLALANSGPALKTELEKTGHRIDKQTGRSSRVDYDIRKLWPVLRALRVFVLSVGIHRQLPTRLIARAHEGDRWAALELVKLDRLFLHDRCTGEVIRKAELQNDWRFQQQLARAQIHRHRNRGRRRGKIPHTIVLFLLFLLESYFREDLLSQVRRYHLWWMLDPDGEEFPSQGAFEKFVERLRVDFQSLFGSVEAPSV